MYILILCISSQLFWISFCNKFLGTFRVPSSMPMRYPATNKGESYVGIDLSRVKGSNFQHRSHTNDRLRLTTSRGVYELSCSKSYHKHIQ